MRLYTLDTHALIWYFTGDPRLGSQARILFHESIRGEATLLVPIIVLAEILDIAEKKRAPVNFGTVLRKIQGAVNFAVIPLSIEILKKAQGLSGIGELHDRIIAATALYFRSVLVTKDERLKNSKGLQVIW